MEDRNKKLRIKTKKEGKVPKEGDNHKIFQGINKATLKKGKQDKILVKN